MIRVSRKSHPRATAAKCVKIARSGRSVLLTGDRRALRRIRDQVTDDVEAFLGTDETGDYLFVGDGDDGGGWLADRV